MKDNDEAKPKNRWKNLHKKKNQAHVNKRLDGHYAQIIDNQIQSLQDGAVMCRNQANFDEYNIVCSYGGVLSHQYMSLVIATFY